MIARLAGVLALGAALALSPLPGPPQADAQTSGRLDLVAQTLFVGEDPVEFVLRTTGAPEGATLEFTILRTPMLTREDLRQSHREAPTGGARLAFFECTIDGDCDVQASLDAGTGGLATVTLLDDLIGEALRSNSGALPVTIRLRDEDDSELDLLRTSLIIPSDSAPTGADVGVAFVGRLVTPLAIQPDQAVQLDVEALEAAATTLASRPGLPVSIEVQPETLTALTQVGGVALDTIVETIDDRPLMRVPWVAMDEEAWRIAGESPEVVGQYAFGNDTLESVIGRSPTGLVRLDRDAGPATLGLLRTVGASAVLVTDAQLKDPPLGSTALRPFQLVDDNGVAIPALHIDAALHDTLDNPNPELGGYQALAELAISAMSAEQDLGMVLDIDRIDPVALDVVLEGTTDHPDLGIATTSDLLDLDLARAPDGSVLRGELVADAPGDVTRLAAEMRTAETSITTFEAMLDPEVGPITPLRTQLRAAPSSSLTTDQALDYATGVTDDVLDATTGIEIAQDERITLTDRRTDLPLTITNTQSLPLNVELLLSAEKLRFPDGSRRSLTLQPGSNQVVIPVETLASGDARVTAVLTSPGGRFQLASAAVDIRSTAISGLGLVISVVALAVLGAWWVRTILRIRRNRAAATVAAVPDHAFENSGPGTTEGEP